MNILVYENSELLGEHAAKHIARLVNNAIAQKGSAGIILSTGASQFDMFKHLITEDVDFSKVDMFHLDEYIGLNADHPASFRKYLKERFVDLLPSPLGSVNYVDSSDPASIEALSHKLSRTPIDVGVIGIGENAHIAFNDPPADFDTKEIYITVTLDEKCRNQQLGEGWFKCPEDVPTQAVTMTPQYILQCSAIISVVPHAVKARAVKATVESDVTPMIPATILKGHRDWTLYLDKNSASELEAEQK